MKYISTIIILILLIVVVAFGSVAFHIITLNGGSNRPNLEIANKQVDLAFEELNRVAFVYATVKNNGGAGNTTVYAKVVIDTRELISCQSVFLKEGESKDLTFKFDVASVWPSEFYGGKNAQWAHTDTRNTRWFSYDVWAEP